MSSNYNDADNYCKDCDRSIYGKYPSCDINIENDGKYTMPGTPCYCKCREGVGMVLKAVICLFKGHDVDPDESIIDDEYMHDKKNWLCRCHRCGLYLAHDGAISQMNILMTKKGAYRFKRDYERDIEQTRKTIESLSRRTRNEQTN